VSEAQHVEVLFTCRACGKSEQSVAIRAREEGESIASWMKTVQRAVGFAHSTLSPHCRSRNVDLKMRASPAGVGIPDKEVIR
jgi:hypothetical protein